MDEKDHVSLTLKVPPEMMDKLYEMAVARDLTVNEMIMNRIISKCMARKPGPIPYIPFTERKCTHHINGNHDDNSETNLITLTNSEHGMVHGIASHDYYKDPDKLAARLKDLPDRLGKL